jgi:hypothetical protein
MSIESRAILKGYFQTGDTPSQSQFENLLDTVFMDEDMLRYKSDAWTDFVTKIGVGNIPVQPHLSSKRITAIIPAHEGSTATLIGFTALSTTGTITAPTWAATNYLTQRVRLLYRSAAGAGSTAHWRTNSALGFWRGDAAGRGGFTVFIQFSIPAQPSGYIFFCGLRGSSAAIGATTEASSLLDCLAIGKDSGDTTLQFMHNDNVGSCTKVDTGLTPATDTMYKLILHCEPNGSTVYCVLVDMQDNTVKATHSIVSGFPVSGSGVTRPFLHISNNATASAVDCESGGFYGEAFN